MTPPRRLRPLLLLLGYGALLSLLSAADLAVNTSPSLPLGLYWTTSVASSRGSLVAVCLPPPLAAVARARCYLPPGRCPSGLAPLGKIVLAQAGDEVLVTPRGLAVNGRAVPRSRPLRSDGEGRPLTAFPPGRYPVRRGEIWLFSPYHPLAWDSRYYGPLPAATVVATLVPVVIAPASGPAGFRLHPFHSRTD